MSARKKPISTYDASEPSMSPSKKSPTSTTPPKSPFLPTRLETLLLAIYPITLLLGSVFSVLSPQNRSAPYSASLQSHPPEFAPSYFAQKKNIFNVYFVKQGWFWTTVAYFLFLITHPSLGPSLRPVITPRRLRGILRYVLVTVTWAGVTQWFFGPALIDRGFRFTGGQCELLRDPEARQGMSETREFWSAAACKMAGGQWKGGHDISGHVFLLILGSAFLWLELLPALTHAEGLRDGRRIAMSDGKIRTVAAEAKCDPVGNGSSREQQVTSFGVKFILGVVGLMWWMLLMTAAFFHTWFEKTTGLLVAFGAIWFVYFLPRGVPAIRAAVGMPGV